MKRLMFACALLFAVGASADPASFRGRWEGTLEREGHTNALALEIDDATAASVRGRLSVDGSEWGPLSDGKVDGNQLTCRADAVQLTALLDGDRLQLSIAVSHGRTFKATLTRKAAAAEHGSGALILAGGGVSEPEIMQRFVDLAGGPHAPIVVIPTALYDAELTPQRFDTIRRRIGELFRTDDVTLLHTRDRAVADSAEFVKPLLRARGVWMLGGETGELLKAYQGTRTERELKAVVARGGVVGGTSAGAVVQSAETLKEDGRTRIPCFGLIAGVLVWPHWSERHAEDALVKYTRQLGNVLGIGIDEATAIEVHGDVFTVLGAGHVGIVDGAMHDGKGYALLSRGDRFDLAKREAFHGTLLVARDGKVLYRHVTSPATSYRIGSLTKQFTAAAILLLEERGKLRTSDPISRFLPESPPEWSGVTIFHLLTHTSGIPSDGSPRLDFTPGSEWTYSNTGYILLGKIVERASGASYGDFVRDNIFVPLAMRGSSVDPELADIAGAGAIRSTADDLVKWSDALFDGKLLSPAAFAKMTTPFRNGYGCALHLVKSASGRRVFANSGRLRGWSSVLEVYPDEKLTIVVLADGDTQLDDEIARELAMMALAPTPAT